LKIFKRIFLPLILATLFFSTSTASAQDSPEFPTYIVQSGDTLGVISLRFGVSVDDLISANNISNPNAISADTKLIIPGLEGINGTLITESVSLGDNLRSLSIKYQQSENSLIRLNRIVSPAEIYAGAALILPQQENDTSLIPFATLMNNQSLLELSIINNLTIWDLAGSNNLINNNILLPGETLYTAQSNDNQTQSTISPYLTSVEINPLPLIQGSVAEILISAKQPLEITGSLDEHTLSFFSSGENQYASYQGIHALLEPGISTVILTGKIENNPAFQFEQKVIIYPMLAGSESLYVDPGTIDPAAMESEEQMILSIVEKNTDSKFWAKPFLCPVALPTCIRSWYGTRRSYNDGIYTSFHSGVDYGTCAPINTLDIYTPSSGTVVYTDELTVRGGTTIVDHGWGIYSGFYHQSEVLVQAGDHVEAGQLIGQIGSTGRVTGPHLHYGLFVNGVRVDPLAWLEPTCQ
jgi:murein DD-endopeptidase MepM/ murein hydrolase activator NlpD